MTEAENRQHAAKLLNRAEVEFDARDTAVVGRVIALIEADVADWLDRELRGTVSRGMIVKTVREGGARP